MASRKKIQLFFVENRAWIIFFFFITRRTATWKKSEIIYDFERKIFAGKRGLVLFVNTKERGERTVRNLVGNKTAGGSRSKFTHEAEKGFSRLGKAMLYIVISLDRYVWIKNEYREREREEQNLSKIGFLNLEILTLNCKNNLKKKKRFEIIYENQLHLYSSL